MHIVTVIPLAKGIQKEQLTYFTAKDLSLGTIVSVPLRSKFIEAIVIGIEPASHAKSDVKDADYQLKKIDKVIGPAPYKESFFKACEKMRLYTASSTGAVINALLPHVLIDRYDEILHPTAPLPTPETSGIKHEKLIFQALLPDRLSWYRTLIREAFAKKESVFICVPTQYDIDRFYEAFSKGIEHYVFRFHGDISKKTLIADYNKCITEPHPILIIGTGMFLSIPRYDIKTIIVEHESADSYKQFSRPFIDIRSFAELLAESDKSKLIFGDTILRPETLHRHEKHELGEIASPLFRLPSVERQIIVDMKEEVDDRGQHTFSVLSETTKKMIQYAQSHNESIFLFTIRKGLAGVTVCHDCSETLLCTHCKTPIVLYGSKQKTATKEARDRIFMCNKCGRKETTNTRCPKCESWNLTPLGIGTDKVVEEVAALFPKATIVQVDKETTSTDAEVNKACATFYGGGGAIMVGTEMAFSCLKEKVTHSALISLDGLLSIPSFNITQKVLHIIEKLQMITERNLIIQTRIPENPILKHTLTGNVLPLFREDLKEREQFGYPPFRRLIKITFRGTAKESEKARAYLEEVFEGYDPQIFSAFVGRVKGEYVTNTVLKIDPKQWPFPPKETMENNNRALYEKLSTLPPAFATNIDPEDLL